MQAYVYAFNDGVAFVSYETPILVNVYGEWYQTKEWYSSTTTRQRNRFKREQKIEEVKEASERKIMSLFNLLEALNKSRKKLELAEQARDEERGIKEALNIIELSALLQEVAKNNE